MLLSCLLGFALEDTPACFVPSIVVSLMFSYFLSLFLFTELACFVCVCVLIPCHASSPSLHRGRQLSA